MKILNIFRNSKSQSGQPWAGIIFRISFLTEAMSSCHCCYKHIRAMFYQDLSHVPDMNSPVYQQQTRLMKRGKKGKKVQAYMPFCSTIILSLKKNPTHAVVIQRKADSRSWISLATCSVLDYKTPTLVVSSKTCAKHHLEAKILVDGELLKPKRFYLVYQQSNVLYCLQGTFTRSFTLAAE